MSGATSTKQALGYGSGDFVEAAFVGTRVDREARVIHGAALLGMDSPTRRRAYNPDAVHRARPLIEGAQVYLNHPPEGQVGEVRDIRHLAGSVERAQGVDDRGIYRGDVRALPGPEGDKLLDLAEAGIRNVGFSLNGHGAYRDHPERPGWTQVEDIDTVRSFDAVTHAGTTQTFFESADPSKGGGDPREETMDKEQVIRELTVEQLATINPTLLGTIRESAAADVREKEVKPLETEKGELKKKLAVESSTRLLESVLAGEKYKQLPDAAKAKVRTALTGRADLTESAIDNAVTEMANFAKSIGVDLFEAKPADAGGGGGQLLGGGGVPAEGGGSGKKTELQECSAIIGAMCGVTPDKDEDKGGAA